jgi:Phage tail sheath C-terminal domain
MAQLSSPGVSVTVIDESFYTPAAAGTVPLFLVASASNKQNGAGTGTAPGTLAANAGKVYLLTSQKDLSDTFGVPSFYTDASNNPIHGGEINEYGLEAAYSFLGVSNRAYVVRADLDLGQLVGTATAPTSPPADGTYWLDTTNTKWGVFQWNAASATTVGGQTFTNQTVTVITDSTLLSSGVPLSSYGTIGQYAIVATTTLLKVYLKKYLTDTAAGTWVEVGTSAWAKSWPTTTGTAQNPTLVSGNTLTINGQSLTGVTTLSALSSAINANSTLTSAGVTSAVINGYLNLYSTGVAVAVSGTSAAGVGITAGSYLAPALTISAHTSVPSYKIADQQASYIAGYPTGSLWIKTTSANLGSDYILKKYSSTAGAFQSQSVGIYANASTALYNLDFAGGGINLPVGTVYAKFNDAELSPVTSSFKFYIRAGVGATTIRSSVIGTTFTAGVNTFTMSESNPGSASMGSAISVSFTATAASSDANLLLTAIQAAGFVNIQASLNSDNSITISHNDGGEIKLVDTANDPLAKIFSTTTTANFFASPTGTAKNYVASLWSPTVAGSGFITVSNSAPTSVPADGQLWYNNAVSDVDIMIHNGTTWVGYLSYNQSSAGFGFGTDRTDPAGPIISATQPTLQSDGTALAHGDLWISTANVESYPQIYKYSFLTKAWTLVDNTDQTSENGVVFADARWGSAGATGATSATIASLLSSDYLDPDAPDPALYPKGTLLWNLRRSGYNVKQYKRSYFTFGSGIKNARMSNADTATYSGTNRWVSVAPNDYQGAGQFGRKAVRAVVVKALTAMTNSNQFIRDEESRVFNLIASPGYVEMIAPMVSLNYDRGLTAFVVGDTPARLASDATTLSNWGNNTALAADNSDAGLVSTDPYLGVYYPWGYTTDLLGNNIVVPPSHMMLRTIALSDNVSYPWFAPAGVRRGGITNASSVGYISSTTGEFQVTALNTGQRDTLAGVHVNPLTYLTGTGLVAYGQYTRQLTASSLDRVNVARLVIYLRRQLSLLAKPYVFEPNDTITRNEIKNAAEQLLLELVGQRAIYDFLVVCDTSNNTPARIDRSELYLDIAIEPVKAVEFIYIPLRLKNTGEIKGLGGK